MMADKKICPILKYHLSAFHLDFILIFNMTYPSKDKDCPHSKKSHGGYDNNSGNSFGVGSGGILAVIVIIIIIIIIIALIAWAAGGWNKGRKCGRGNGEYGGGGY